MSRSNDEVAKARVSAVQLPKPELIWLMAEGKDIRLCPLCGGDKSLSWYACGDCRERYGAEEVNSVIKEEISEVGKYLDTLAALGRCNADQLVQEAVAELGDYTAPRKHTLDPDALPCPFYGYGDIGDSKCMGGRMPIPEELGGGHMKVCHKCFKRIVHQAGFCRSCGFPLPEGHEHDNCPYCYEVWQVGNGISSNEEEQKKFVLRWLGLAQKSAEGLAESKAARIYSYLLAIARSALDAGRYSLAYRVVRGSEKYLYRAKQAAAEAVESAEPEVGVVAEAVETHAEEPEAAEDAEKQVVFCFKHPERKAATGAFNSSRGPLVGSFQIAGVGGRRYSEFVDQPLCSQCAKDLERALEYEEVDEPKSFIRVATPCPGYSEDAECGAWASGALCKFCWQKKQEAGQAPRQTLSKLRNLLAYFGRKWLGEIDVAKLIQPVQDALDEGRYNEVEEIARSVANEAASAVFEKQHALFIEASDALSYHVPDFVQDVVSEAVEHAEEGDFLKAAKLLEREIVERCYAVLQTAAVEKDIRITARNAKDVFDRSRLVLSTPDLSFRSRYCAEVLDGERKGAPLGRVSEKLEYTLREAYGDCLKAWQRFEQNSFYDPESFSGAIKLREEARESASKKQIDDGSECSPTLAELLLAVELMLEALEKAADIYEAQIEASMGVSAFFDKHSGDGGEDVKTQPEPEQVEPSRGELEREQNQKVAERAMEEAMQMQARGGNGDRRAPSKTVRRGGRARRVRGGGGSEDAIIAAQLDAYAESIVS